MKRIFHRCLDLLYPPKCVFCDTLLQQGEEYFCRACGEKVPMAEDGKVCRTGTYFDRCAAPLYYDGMVRDSFLDYKFHEKTWRAATYAAFLEPYVRKEFPELDLVTWVPLGRRSQKDRGFDQSELLARELAKRLELPCEKILEKVRDTQQQSRLQMPEERRANVLGAYALKQGVSVRGRRILVVDDVITTGSTIDECCRVLCTAGAAEIHCVALAQAKGKVAKSAQEAEKDNEALAKRTESQYNNKME